MPKIGAASRLALCACLVRVPSNIGMRSRSNRREFLALAAGGAAAVVLGREAASGTAATLPQLASASGASVSGGVQRFQSRPDLLAPEVVIDHAAKASLGGVVVTDSHLGPPQSGPLILDQTGRIVWFHPLAAEPSSPQRAFNVSVQHYGGQPVLCWFAGVVTGSHGVGYGLGSYTIVGTDYGQIAQVSGQGGYQGDLHEFQVTPEGTALFTCYGQAQGRVRVGGRVRSVPYLYGVIQEVEISSGKLLWQWRSDRHVALSESYKAPVLEPGWVWDYFHINAISIDPDDRNLVISGRNTCACYKIDRRTGRVLWRLGGKHSDFAMGSGTRFHFQHDANIHPYGLLTLFDNEGGPPQLAAQSRALVLAIDAARRRVSLVHAFRHQPAVYSDALGSVQPVGDGTWFVGWGRATDFTRYSSSGEVLFDGHLSPGSSSYRAFLQQWNGTPSTTPAIAVARSGHGATVYASWNGASQLARWIVLGGPTATQLRQLGIADVAGFETAIALPSAPACLAVVAADASGRQLASSKVLTAA